MRALIDLLDELEGQDIHPTSQRFIEVCVDMIRLHLKKGRDYGSTADPFLNVRNSEAFGMPAWVGVALRAQDKLIRIQTAATQTLKWGKPQLANESLEDAFIDFGVYAGIGLVLLREWQRQIDPDPRPSLEEAFAKAEIAPNPEDNMARFITGGQVNIAAPRNDL